MHNERKRQLGNRKAYKAYALAMRPSLAKQSKHTSSVLANAVPGTCNINPKHTSIETYYSPNCRVPAVSTKKTKDIEDAKRRRQEEEQNFLSTMHTRIAKERALRQNVVKKYLRIPHFTQPKTMYMYTNAEKFVNHRALYPYEIPITSTIPVNNADDELVNGGFKWM